MARPNIPLDITRLVIEGHAASKPWVNTFWLHTPSSGTPTGTQMNTLAHDLIVLFNAMWTQVTNATAATTQALVSWNDGNGNVVEGSDATGVAGSGSGGLTVAQLAWVISWRQSSRYRGGHPRTYLAGIDTGELQDNATFKTATIAALQTAVNTFFAGVNALNPTPFTSVTLGVLRQFANGGSETKPPTYLTPPVFHAFTNGVVKPGIATQRRRLGDNLS